MWCSRLVGIKFSPPNAPASNIRRRLDLYSTLHETRSIFTLTFCNWIFYLKLTHAKRFYCCVLDQYKLHYTIISNIGFLLTTLTWSHKINCLNADTNDYKNFLFYQIKKLHFISIISPPTISLRLTCTSINHDRQDDFIIHCNKTSRCWIRRVLCLTLCLLRLILYL